MTVGALVLPLNVDTGGILEYGAWLGAQGLSPRTIEQRTGFAAGRFREWGTWDVAAERVAAWLGQYYGWSRLTYHAHLVSIFKWAVETGRIGASPLARVRKPPTPRPRPRPLSQLELRRALGAADGPLRSWLMLGYLAGLRAHEIAKFRGEEIAADCIALVGKGGQGAILPTHPGLWELAQQYPRVGYWFPSRTPGHDHVSGNRISQVVGAHFRALGIDGSIHRCRATYGTTLLRSGANIRVVQELMRHASLATTAHYLGVDESEKQAALAALVA